MQETTIPTGLERRKEDYRLITGRARYVDDVRLPAGRPATLYMTVVRSPYAHARITSIRLEAAKALPGVIAALTGADLANDLRPPDIPIPLPGLKKPERRPKVRGVSTQAIALGELARLVEEQLDLIEHEPPNPANGKPIEGLAAWRDFAPPGATFSSGAHVAVSRSIPKPVRCVSSPMWLWMTVGAS